PDHVNHLALVDPTLDRQAFIGTYAGEYQLWVNVTAFLLQAFVASRLVRHRGLAGVLLALPLIALGGYSIIAAGAGFALVRWIKTAENATDYSIMNTARQLLWLPTTRDEKYKAKQAIDTFFVRGGDVLSAAAVYSGTTILHLCVAQFAGVNVALTLAWLTIAARIACRRLAYPRVEMRRVAAAASFTLPAFANQRVTIQMYGHWLDAPNVPFDGIGNDSSGHRGDFAYRTATVGASVRVQAAPFVAVGGGVDMLAVDATDANPTYRRSRLFAELDWRTSPSYTRRGGFYRLDWSDHHD